MEARKSLRTSDIALTTAILIGAISILISAATAYFTAESYGHITTRFLPIRTELNSMGSRVGRIDSKLSNLKRDTLNTRVLSMPKDTINSKIINKSFRSSTSQPSATIDRNNAAHSLNP